MYAVACEVEKLSNDGTIKTTATTEDYEMDGIIASMSAVLTEHVARLTAYCGVGLVRRTRADCGCKRSKEKRHRSISRVQLRQRTTILTSTRNHHNNMEMAIPGHLWKEI